MTCLDLHPRRDRTTDVRRLVLLASIGVMVVLPTTLSLITAL